MPEMPARFLRFAAPALALALAAGCGAPVLEEGGKAPDFGAADRPLPLPPPVAPAPLRPAPGPENARGAVPAPEDPALERARRFLADAELADQSDLVLFLGSEDPAEAEKARIALRNRQGSAREALLAGLEYSNPRIRRSCALLLLLLEDPRDDALLLRHLRDGHKEVRGAAAVALSGPSLERSPPATPESYTPYLLALLRREKPPERGETIYTSDTHLKECVGEALAHTMRSGEVPLLFDLLMDTDADIRRVARKTLVQVTGRDPAKHAPRENLEEGWRAWWEKEKDKFRSPADLRRAEREKRAEPAAPSPPAAPGSGPSAPGA